MNAEDKMSVEAVDNKLKMKVVESDSNTGAHKIQGRVERRASARLMKDIAMTTEDRIQRMGKKRNLEGLYKESFQEQIGEGVKILLAMAQRIMATQRGAPQNTLRLLPAPEEDGDQDEP